MRLGLLPCLSSRLLDRETGGSTSVDSACYRTAPRAEWKRDSTHRRGSFLRRWLGWPASLLLVAGPLIAGDLRSSLVMVEGSVVSVAEKPGEGELSIVAVKLASRSGDAETLELLLAPQPALDEIGFEVQVGDRLKARIFPSQEGPARVHKVLNLTRHTMVRVRTLSQIPLWDGSGAWQGGPCLGLQGPRAEGAGGRRRGPPR